MKQKNGRFWKALTVSALLVLSMAVLASCADKENPDGAELTNPPISESGGEQTTQHTYKTQHTYNLKDFTVVRPKGSDSQIGDAVSAIYETLDKIGIDNPTLTDDGALSADASRKEILVGATNRPESTEAMAALSSNDEYALMFSENKIVLAVRHNDALASAVKTLCEKFLASAQNGVLDVNRDSYLGQADFEAVELANAEQVNYNVVLPAKATEVEKNVATRVVALLERYAGKTVDLTYDDMEPYRADACNVLIGRTSYPETKQVLSSLANNEYAVRSVGNKVVVAAHASMTLSEAGELLLDKIKVYGDAKLHTVTLNISDAWKGENNRFLFEYPAVSFGNLQFDLDDANQNLMLSYANVKTADCDAYRLAAEAMGYTLWQSNQIGQNLFHTYRSDKGELCLAFYPKQSGGTMQIFTNPFTDTAPIPNADEPYTKVTEATLHVMSLDYTHRTVYDGHGMNYVITLEDGRYIVMDGGYNASSGSKDDERIYNYLVENNRRADGKVVIAAWFMSHPHGDHYGAFESFVPKYKNNVTIEYFIANPYSASVGGDNWMLSSLPKLLAQTNTKLIKPHPGQIVTFCNTELEVVYTHENLYTAGNLNPAAEKGGALADSNNSSTVIRLRQNGHTALFTGDASTGACNKMVSLYGDALKSDIFQVNHHGYSGGTWSLYDAATREDSYVLWTCSKEAFFYRTIGEWVEGKSIVDGNILEPNRDLALKVGFERCFYADGVVEQITFPAGEEIRISENQDFVSDPKNVPVSERP